MSHTPGPWKVGTLDKVINYLPIYARIGVTKLACIAKTDGREVGFGISQQEMEANARLIAAAPELLGALQTIAGATTCAGNSDPDVMEDILADIQGICAKAIAKAKGEKQ